MASAATGIVIAVWVSIAKLMGITTPWGWTSTVAIMLFIGGMQMLIPGIFGEYLSRMYDEVRGPLYVISGRVGFVAESRPARVHTRTEVSQAADATRIR